MRFVDAASLMAWMINDLFAVVSFLWTGSLFVAHVLGKKISEYLLMASLFPMLLVVVGQVAIALTCQIDEQVGLLIGLSWWTIILFLGGSAILFVLTFIVGRTRRK